MLNVLNPGPNRNVNESKLNIIVIISANVANGPHINNITTTNNLTAYSSSWNINYLYLKCYFF